MNRAIEWASQTLGLPIDSHERLRTLWGGYGELFRLRSGHQSFILKSVSPPASPDESSFGHQRKLRSYAVETYFYRHLAPKVTHARLAKLLGAEGPEQLPDNPDPRWLILLEDLDADGFTGRGRAIPRATVIACLRWLAGFHATFLQGPNDETGVWHHGTYWHLSTRPDELAYLRDTRPELADAAAAIDNKLQQSPYRTLVHGDAKTANFCFHEDGHHAAAVDFQYVGGGIGVQDVAYLLLSASPSGELIEDRRLLDVYFDALGELIESEAVIADWRARYIFACADYYRFYAGWAPERYQSEPVGERVIQRALALIHQIEP